MHTSGVGGVEKDTALATDRLRLRDGLARSTVRRVFVGERLVISRT